MATARKKKVLVGLIMGSDSDWKIMKEASKLLKEFGVGHEIEIVSAHRTPKKMFSYAESAEARGLRVIIAGAGGAAHLPGMVASLTSLPVIGVPVAATALQGQDSLLSIVQMPKAVPVATVAINNSYNAGLLAVRILAAGGKEVEKSLLKKLSSYRLKIEKQVLSKKLRN